MRSVTVYIADDGNQFNTAQEALERDMLCAEVKEVVGVLKPTPSYSFDGYVQQDASAVQSVREKLYALVLKYGLPSTLLFL